MILKISFTANDFLRERDLGTDTSISLNNFSLKEKIQIQKYQSTLDRKTKHKFQKQLERADLQVAGDHKFNQIFSSL